MSRRFPSRALAPLAALIFLLCLEGGAFGQGGSGSLSRDSGASSVISDVAGGAVQATVKRSIARRPITRASTTPRRTRPATPGRKLDADDYNDQGDTFLNAGKYPEALNAYKQAVRLKPDMAEAHYSMGWIYNELNQYDQAVDALNQAIRYKPDY